MRRFAVCIAAGLMLYAGSASAQPAAPKARATAPEIPYDAPPFIKMPAGLYLGESMGVATNSKGHVYVYTRSGETRLFEFDQNGVFVKEIGAGSYAFSFAHSVRVDKDDNIWAVDEGTNLVIKFNPEGKILMVIGKRPDPLGQLALMPGGSMYSGANKPYSFNRQTDVAFDAQQNIFVSDGYSDGRVVKFDKNGKFLKAAGTRGNGPLQFNTPHSIAVDAKGTVYVGDRGNSRVVVLDNDLNQKATYNDTGAPWAVCVSPGAHQYLFVSNSYPDNDDSRNLATTGEVYKMELDGTVVGKFGQGGKQPKQFATLHQMDCRNPDQLYTAEINNWRVQKVILHPAPPRSSSAN